MRERCSLRSDPGYAGTAFAEVGVEFQWDLKGYDWGRNKKLAS